MTISEKLMIGALIVAVTVIGLFFAAEEGHKNQKCKAACAPYDYRTNEHVCKCDLTKKVIDLE